MMSKDHQPDREPANFSEKQHLSTYFEPDLSPQPWPIDVLDMREKKNLI
jgi:hypothetical protein